MSSVGLREGARRLAFYAIMLIALVFPSFGNSGGNYQPTRSGCVGGANAPAYADSSADVGCGSGAEAQQPSYSGGTIADDVEVLSRAMLTKTFSLEGSVDTTHGASVDATLVCNGWLADGKLSVDIEMGDVFDICGWRAGSGKAAEVGAGVGQRTEVIVVHTVRRGENLSMIIASHAVQGASMKATRQCSSLGSLMIHPGDRIFVCKYSDSSSG